uniref:Uncharacterized protein n=1 Tax=Melopsittacus undulatus TaxID=13146 RepID=A0A8C6J433_MELUD
GMCPWGWKLALTSFGMQAAAGHAHAHSNSPSTPPLVPSWKHLFPPGLPGLITTAPAGDPRPGCRPQPLVFTTNSRPKPSSALQVISVRVLMVIVSATG